MKSRKHMERKWEKRLNEAKSKFQKDNQYQSRNELEGVLDALPRKSSLLVRTADGKMTLIKDKRGWHYNGEIHTPVLMHNVLYNSLPERRVELTLPTGESMTRKDMLTYIISAYGLPDDKNCRRIVDGILDYAYFHIKEQERTKFIYDMLGNSIGLTTAEIKEFEIK